MKRAVQNSKINSKMLFALCDADYFDQEKRS